MPRHPVPRRRATVVSAVLVTVPGCRSSGTHPWHRPDDPAPGKLTPAARLYAASTEPHRWGKNSHECSSAPWLGGTSCCAAPPPHASVPGARLSAAGHQNTLVPCRARQG